MATFELDAYKGFTEPQLKQRCRELVREVVAKDHLICELVECGSVDKMPKVFADDVRRIVSVYHDEDPVRMTAEEWNAKYEPGIRVLVKEDDGSLLQSRTRSFAWTLGSGQPVVLLDGRAGGYDLSRVKPV